MLRNSSQCDCFMFLKGNEHICVCPAYGMNWRKNIVFLQGLYFSHSLKVYLKSPYGWWQLQTTGISLQCWLFWGRGTHTTELPTCLLVMHTWWWLPSEVGVQEYGQMCSLMEVGLWPVPDLTSMRVCHLAGVILPSLCIRIECCNFSLIKEKTKERTKERTKADSAIQSLLGPM